MVEQKHELKQVEFMRVKYAGKTKDDNSVFDKSDDTGFIVGDGKLIKGFERALLEMKPGEKQTIEITPEDAYGERNPELVKLVPQKVFEDNNITPRPGLVVTLENGMPAKIQSVSGGRVRVDFNHELAGKTLVFDIELLKKIKDNESKIRLLFEHVFHGVSSEKLKIVENEKEKSLEITLPEECTREADLQNRKLVLLSQIKKYVGVTRINVIEQY